jgi:Lon protease-like protein
VLLFRDLSLSQANSRYNQDSFCAGILGARVSSALLPVFPLEVVLFPGAPLPLHIFEPRYKEMIGECLERTQLFGVVRAQEGGIAQIGCTAEILNVARKYPDGRLDIVTEGRKRFQVVEVNQDRTFLQAEVRYVEDTGETAAPDRTQRALALHNEMLAIAGAAAISPDQKADISFRLAAALPLDLDVKQALLVMVSEAERIDALITCYEALIPSLRKTADARRKAGGNGQVR